jgi:citrate synthase
VPKTAKLIIDDKTIELPIVEGTEGEKAIDISRLRAETGYITLDPGFGNTGACTSTITFIDGEKGILRHRGIPIEELAEKSNFIEVAWMLIFGKLPNATERERFRRRLTENAPLHEAMRHHFEGFPVNAPPMAVVSAMINTLSCFHQQFLDSSLLDDPDVFEELAARLISKVRTIAAFAYRRSIGRPFIYPDPKLSYVRNFLHMMFSQPYDQHIADLEIEDALDLFLLLHADHEQNCSTSTARVVGSSDANLFASTSAAVSALWGPLHGGANVEVINMLERIHSGGLTAEQVVEKAKKKEMLLYGFGHRVYRNYDPRARILKPFCDRVLEKTGHKNDPLLNIARKLEEIALQDKYFIDRKLYPNVDFYSGIILRAIGIPTNMFTVMFTIGRMPGWIAQWREQHADKSTRIARPRQIYVGEVNQRFVPMDERP